MKAKRFNPYDVSPQISPFGDTYNPAGECRNCGRNVFTVTDEHRTNDEPDPRGFAGPRNSRSTFEEYPDVPFCWDCRNEHGLEGYKRCELIAINLTKVAS